MSAPSPFPAARRRLSPAASREAALEAARMLLVDHGPQALTLKAVATRVGRSHATLLHHFGSAAGLQRALIARMADAITGTIRDAVLAADGRDAGAAPDHAAIVDLVFDTFGSGGAGALAGWMILTGDRAALDPVLHAIHALVDDLTERRADPGADHAPPIADRTLHLLLMALGDSLLGAAVTRALGLPEDRARTLATGMVAGATGM